VDRVPAALHRLKTRESSALQRPIHTLLMTYPHLGPTSSGRCLVCS
jgi:hypothetical protein